MLISKKMINTYKENEILVLNYTASMISDFALLGMFIIRQAKMKKRFQIFKNSFQSFKDAYSKKSAFEKKLKNDEKVEKFGKVEEVITKETLSKLYRVEFEIMEIEGKPLSIWY